MCGVIVTDNDLHENNRNGNGILTLERDWAKKYAAEADELTELRREVNALRQLAKQYQDMTEIAKATHNTAVQERDMLEEQYSELDLANQNLTAQLGELQRAYDELNQENTQIAKRNHDAAIGIQFVLETARDAGLDNDDSNLFLLQLMLTNIQNRLTDDLPPF